MTCGATEHHNNGSDMVSVLCIILTCSGLYHGHSTGTRLIPLSLGLTNEMGLFYCDSNNAHESTMQEL